MTTTSPVTVRRMVPADVDSVVALHIRAFPHYFATRLGPGFLRHLYLTTLDEISLVAVVDGEVVGYHVTYARPTRVFGRLLLRHGWRFARLAAPVAFRSLHHLRRLLLAPLKPMQARQPKGGAISMYTAVAPSAGGRGVATKLLYQMVAEANARGVKTIRGENEEDPRLCALYERAGFHVVGSMRSLDGEPKLVTHGEVAAAVALIGAELPAPLWLPQMPGPGASSAARRRPV